MLVMHKNEWYRKAEIVYNKCSTSGQARVPVACIFPKYTPIPNILMTARVEMSPSHPPEYRLQM